MEGDSTTTRIQFPANDRSSREPHSVKTVQHFMSPPPCSEPSTAIPHSTSGYSKRSQIYSGAEVSTHVIGGAPLISILTSSLQDSRGGRRRLLLSSSVREPSVSPLVARVPFVTMATGQVIDPSQVSGSDYFHIATYTVGQCLSGSAVSCH